MTLSHKMFAPILSSVICSLLSGICYLYLSVICYLLAVICYQTQTQIELFLSNTVKKIMHFWKGMRGAQISPEKLGKGGCVEIGPNLAAFMDQTGTSVLDSKTAGTSLGCNFCKVNQG